MRLEMHPDVQAVAEFMHNTIPAARLVEVAAGIDAVAPLLWGHYEREAVRSLTLTHLPISAGDPHKRSTASGCYPAELCAGGDPAGAGDCP